MLELDCNWCSNSPSASAAIARPVKTANLGGNAYASLREFIHGVEDDSRVEIFKATKNAHKERRAPPNSSEFVFFAEKMTQVQRDDGDASVQWVLKGQEDAWRRRHRCVGRV